MFAFTEASFRGGSRFLTSCARVHIRAVIFNLLCIWPQTDAHLKHISCWGPTDCIGKIYHKRFPVIMRQLRSKPGIFKQTCTLYVLRYVWSLFSTSPHPRHFSSLLVFATMPKPYPEPNPYHKQETALLVDLTLRIPTQLLKVKKNLCCQPPCPCRLMSQIKCSSPNVQ